LWEFSFWVSLFDVHRLFFCGNLVFGLAFLMYTDYFLWEFSFWVSLFDVHRLFFVGI
jgi:hypothetical protein